MSGISIQELEAQFGELLPEREALGCFGRSWDPCHSFDPCHAPPCHVPPQHCDHHEYNPCDNDHRNPCEDRDGYGGWQAPDHHHGDH
jgi:hypothetical protein